VSPFPAHFRAVLKRCRRFDFDQQLAGLGRAEQAVAFLALLELRKANEVTITQAAPFAPIRVEKETAPAGERRGSWTSVRSA
jgi:chromatin segregation and condensation protein Rec8/ScpA/Scc1 (kleisin family)